jgi:hypothetical protein
VGELELSGKGANEIIQGFVARREKKAIININNDDNIFAVKEARIHGTLNKTTM